METCPAPAAYHHLLRGRSLGKELRGLGFLFGPLLAGNIPKRRIRDIASGTRLPLEGEVFHEAGRARDLRLIKAEADGKLVGAIGFEPTTSCAQARHDTRCLRYPVYFLTLFGSSFPAFSPVASQKCRSECACLLIFPSFWWLAISTKLCQVEHNGRLPRCINYSCPTQS